MGFTAVKLNRDSHVFMCQLTTGSLKGVDPPSVTIGHVINLEKELLFVFSKFKTLLIPTSCCSFDSVELSCVRKCINMTTVHLVQVVIEMF